MEHGAKRRQTCVAIVGLAAQLASATQAFAQTDRKPPVVAHLDASDRADWWAVLQQKLRELGYLDGRNIAFEVRSAKGALDQLPAMAKELVRLNVAVIVTSGTAAALAARRASPRVPIVMATGTDQVSLGLAASLSHPGGNVTGLSTITSELAAKRFELLRECIPGLTKVAVLWDLDNVSSMASIRDIETVAGKSQVTLLPIGVGASSELPEAFSTMTRERVHGVIVIQTPLMFADRKKIAELAITHRLPSMFGAAEYVADGGLLSYAPSYPELYRRAAVYVDKILKGANPADLPIEQPTAVELVVNARTARLIGLAVPQPMLGRATRVIQ
jgi:putative ABC transport system substrate-binding protein